MTDDASRPASTHDLARRFPQGDVYLVEDIPHHLLGYRKGEDGDYELILTPMDPTDDYEAARTAAVRLAARHFGTRIVPTDAGHWFRMHERPADAGGL